MPTRREQLLYFVGAHPDCSFPEITAGLGVSRSHASDIVDAALKAGELLRYGRRRLYTYRLAPKRAPTRLGPASIFHLAESL